MPKIKSHLKDLYRMKPKASRRGFIRLDMNEGVPGLSWDFMRQAIGEINPELISAYPEYGNLEKKIAAHNRLRPENICLSNGSDAAIKYIFDAYCLAKDKVLFVEPTFAMYSIYCKIFNAKPVILNYRNDFSFPAEDFLEHISSGIKIAIVVNPNNPTGTGLRRNEIIGIIKKAADNGILMIIDEAYFYFYPETVIGKIKEYKNLIVLRTFSKLCAMAGLRLGYAAANAGIIENLKKVKSSYDVNSLAVLFAERLMDRPDIIQKLKEETETGKQYLIQRLNMEGIEYKDTLANFVLISCKNNTSDIVTGLEREKILVGSGFKHDFLRDYIRVTIGNKDIMKNFWEAFVKIWDNHNNRKAR